MQRTLKRPSRVYVCVHNNNNYRISCHEFEREWEDGRSWSGEKEMEMK